MTDITTTDAERDESDERTEGAYRLCYAEGNRAWFTDLDNFDELRTDDWDDGWRQDPPYTSDDYDLLKVVFNGPIQNANQEIPPGDINTDDMAWLESVNGVDASVSIRAKCTLTGFIESVQNAGGEVYLPVTRAGIFENLRGERT